MLMEEPSISFANTATGASENGHTAQAQEWAEAPFD
jgi:hypothetical protein